MAEFIPLISAEEENEVSWYKAAAAGIASGVLKVPEGVVSLAAELIDLGMDTDKAAEVEQFFDKLNPFEEVAEERAIGKITEALVSIGVPGGIGFKLGSSAIKAKKAGNYANIASKNAHKATSKVKRLNDRAGIKRFAAGVAGGAAGETLVADVEDIGSFGDFFEGSPTEMDRSDYLDGREDATRKLLNRLKFGAESTLLTPFVFGVGKSAKALAKNGQELAYSNSKFYRWLDKYVRSPFTPSGDLPDEVFKSEMLKQGLKARDVSRAKQIVNNITQTVNKMFPETQAIFDKSVRSEKEAFMKQVNDLLFEGNLRQPLDGKKVDNLVDGLKLKNVTENQRQKIVTGINDARKEFTGLIDILDNNIATGDKLKEGVKSLKEILRDRVQAQIGSTYKIFEDRGGLFKMFRGYEPTDEAYTNAVNLFRRLIARNDKLKKKPYDPNSNMYVQEARDIVDDVLNQLGRRKKAGALPDIAYTSKTMGGGQRIKSFDKAVGRGSKIFRELAGEIQDPRYSIFNAITNLSTIARLSVWLGDVAAKNDAIQSAGGRGFFWASEDAAKAGVNQLETGINIVKVDDVMREVPGGTRLVNPLAGKYTTVEIAEAIKRANDIPNSFQSFVRGENKEASSNAVSWFYRNLLLFPKGISQIGKTVLSIPTHIRNFMSAGAFAGANGVLFEGLTQPKLLAKAFREGIDVSGLMKFGPTHPKAQAAYNELLELGVVNSQVQIGDLKNLLRDLKFGEQASNTDAVLRPMLSKFKKILEGFQGKYVAEDDTWKITNYVVELDRLKRAATKQGITLSDDVVKGLKKEAADIVKNTVPNYAYVGSFVKTARLLPVGNFMSFPSEMIRTTTNIAGQGLKEIRHSRPTRGSNIGPVVFEIGKGFVKNDAITRGTYGTGMKRLSGMATTLTVVPTAVVEGAKALYDVTEDEINALRQFVPEWSKNSTLVPLRDDEGNLSYIDFSHSNAYDVISRPFRTLMLNVMEGEQDDKTLLNGFLNGISEASGEIMNPFISESIWTEAATDLLVRGGRTAEGKQLYTDETAVGDKMAIQFAHLGKALLPSFRQYQRLIQAATEAPTERGKELELDREIAGFMGLRPIEVDPLESMGFKIAEYQEGIRNARREFTGGRFGVLKGGRVTPNEIIERYLASNKARFDVQKEMYKNIDAAGLLGTRNIDLRREFKDRQLSDRTFNKLQRGKFDPYYPSLDIQARFREIARNLGDQNPFIIAAPTLRQMRRDFNSLNLFEDFDLNLSEYIFEDLGLAPAAPITTPLISPAAITSGTAAANTENVLPTGLTRTETALLSPEEQAIRLRSRGLS